MALLADESNCPVGRSYAVDPFDGSTLDTTNKWLTPALPYVVSGGAFHPPAGASALPILGARNMTFTGAFKMAGQYSAGPMDGGITGQANKMNYFGVAVWRSTWTRVLSIAHQADGGTQRIVTGTIVPAGTPVFTTRLAGLAQGTTVRLSIEFDGVSLLTYRLNGTVIHTETKPSGTVENVAAYFGTFTVGGGGVSLPETWLLDWAYFWPYTGLGGLPCFPWPSAANIMPSSTGRVAHARIAVEARGEREAGFVHGHFRASTA